MGSEMNDTNVIDTATRRLQSALDALEAALERRREGDREQTDFVGQIHALGIDRSRLAGELDTAAARSRRLETTNREVVQRLDAAIETIRTLLDGHSH
jgi:uncharacterized membrane protein YccC